MRVGEIHEKCAVVGVVTQKRYAVRAAYYSLFALQHRGQESTGIASLVEGQITLHGGEGLVAHVYDPADIDRLKSNIAIGHNRYSTSGDDGGSHLQPITDGLLNFAFAHNGNLPTTQLLEQYLRKRRLDPRGLNDSQMMAAAIGTNLRDGMSLAKAVLACWELFTGAFSCVALMGDTIVAFRDECGIRPLSIGRLEDGYVVASETCAFDTIGAAFLRDVAPGEIVSIGPDGINSIQAVPSRLALDVFEYVYFARPDSLLMGRKVNEVRRKLGRNLAKEHTPKGDVVIPVPDSAIPAAIGYAEQSGIRFDHGFIKNRYIHRTFIKPTQEMRDRDVRIKLNPVPEVVMGKRVIVIDDSLVRGTTTKQIVSMLYGAGAREVHLLLSSPPVRFPDFYGINTPDPRELIAAVKTEEQIREHVGAASLGYLSKEGMVRATGWPASKLNLSCFDGNYPIDIGEANRAALEAVAVAQT